MSVLKSKRSTSKAEYVNLANEIYTETGRIITHGCRDGMKRARRKLRFFQGEVAAGRKTVEEVARWLNDGPIAYYEQFNDHGRVLKLRRVFYAMFIKDRNTEEVKPCIGS